MMASFINDQIQWQETMNGVTIDCSLDVAIHPVDSGTIILTIPGVDGSVNGYDDKYIRMIEVFQEKYDAAAVRIANPFITSHHWESNPRQALKYIQENIEKITSQSSNAKIIVVAHSAGAAIIAKIAHEYPEIQTLLLINPAKKLFGSSQMVDALVALESNTIVAFGSEDPSVDMADDLRNGGVVVHVVEGADHNFSGEYLNRFINLPVEMIAEAP